MLVGSLWPGDGLDWIGGTCGCENSPVLCCEIAHVLRVELHDWGIDLFVLWILVVVFFFCRGYCVQWGRYITCTPERDR